MNPYRYCGNQPTTYVDPSGLAGQPASTCTCTVVSTVNVEQSGNASITVGAANPLGSEEGVPPGQEIPFDDPFWGGIAPPDLSHPPASIVGPDPTNPGNWGSIGNDPGGNGYMEQRTVRRHIYDLRDFMPGPYGGMTWGEIDMTIIPGWYHPGTWRGGGGGSATGSGQPGVSGGNPGYHRPDGSGGRRPSGHEIPTAPAHEGGPDPGWRPTGSGGGQGPSGNDPFRPGHPTSPLFPSGQSPNGPESPYQPPPTNSPNPNGPNPGGNPPPSGENPPPTGGNPPPPTTPPDSRRTTPPIPPDPTPVPSLPPSPVPAAGGPDGNPPTSPVSGTLANPAPGYLRPNEDPIRGPYEAHDWFLLRGAIEYERAGETRLANAYANALVTQYPRYQSIVDRARCAECVSRQQGIARGVVKVGVATVVLAAMPEAILPTVAAGAGFGTGYSATSRSLAGQSPGQVVGGTVCDLAGVTSFWVGAYNRDFVTDQYVGVWGEQRGEAARDGYGSDGRHRHAGRGSGARNGAERVGPRSNCPRR